MKFKKLLKKNKKGVFGLNSVQAFFMIILSIALLAYVIVIIMGALSGSTILTQDIFTVTNETGTVNATTHTLATASTVGFSNPTITALFNRSSDVAIELANATVTSAGIVSNATAVNWRNVSISYTYSADTAYQQNLDTVLTNTSTGIAGFFSSIEPVYAILAVLVIILVLVVLVRVVQNPKGSVSSQL